MNIGKIVNDQVIEVYQRINELSHVENDTIKNDNSNKEYSIIETENDTWKCGLARTKTLAMGLLALLIKNIIRQKLLETKNEDIKETSSMFLETIFISLTH